MKKTEYRLTPEEVGEAILAYIEYREQVMIPEDNECTLFIDMDTYLTVRNVVLTVWQ